MVQEEHVVAPAMPDQIRFAEFLFALSRYVVYSENPSILEVMDDDALGRAADGLQLLEETGTLALEQACSVRREANAIADGQQLSGLIENSDPEAFTSTRNSTGKPAKTCPNNQDM